MKKKIDMKEKIYNAIEPLPLTINQIAKKVGTSYNNAYKYILKLQVDGLIKERIMAGIKTFYREKEK